MYCAFTPWKCYIAKQKYFCDFEAFLNYVNLIDLPDMLQFHECIARYLL